MVQTQAVLFDYGLVLTGPPDPHAWQVLGELTGLPEDQLAARYWQHRPEYDRGGLSGSAYWNAVTARTLSAPELQALCDADTRLWTQPNQPMIEWAARLQAAGTPTGILSNLGDAMTAGVLRELPWMRAFPAQVFSHQVGIIKPDPAIYARAARTMALPAPAILFVDDRQENIQGAVESGMQGIQYGGHAAFVQELFQRGLGTLWDEGRLPLCNHLSELRLRRSPASLL